MPLATRRQSGVCIASFVSVRLTRMLVATSFCSVDVIGEIEDDIDIELDEADIRTDVYRASGKGGQHVNRTESAVRLTHLPTGIVVTCQNERSQIKNKATAMRILKSRIYEKMEDEKRSEMKFYGEKGEIAWGIRFALTFFNLTRW